MTSRRAMLMAARSRAQAGVSVGDVFSRFAYTGDDATGRDVVTNVNMSDRGGLEWIKSRSVSGSHVLTDTVRGPNNNLFSDFNFGSNGNTSRITGFNIDGFEIGANSLVNTDTEEYIGWGFAIAPRFFDIREFSHTNGVASNIDLSELNIIGFAHIKRTDTTGDWYSWHKDLTASNNLKLDTTAGESATNAFASVSGTTLTLSASAATGTYIVYAWAHDPDGLIACSAYTGDNTTGKVIDVGFSEGSQYTWIKRIDAAGDWFAWDSSRGIIAGNDPHLSFNTDVAEITTDDSIDFDNSGFIVNQRAATNINVNLAEYVCLTVIA